MAKQFSSIFAKKLNRFLPLSRAELVCLEGLLAERVKIKRGKQLTHEGQTGHKVFVLHSGWACSFKILGNGNRQIISFPIAGDCVGLRSVLMRRADHSFSALTDAIVTPLDGTQYLECVTKFPRLGAALLWAASRDETMVVEHLVNIGRRSAIERTAHFLMELAERLNLVGLATEDEFKCPISQFDLADALGLTSIHINRVLRELREKQLLTMSRGIVRIHDLNGLRKLAGFQGGYLNARE